MLKGQPFDNREYVFAERGWHFGPVTRTDGFDLVRSVTTDRYHFIYNAIPEREFGPVDMAKGNIAWEAVKAAYEKGELSDLHERLYFRTPRPIFELYDLNEDIAEQKDLSQIKPGIVQQLTKELESAVQRGTSRPGNAQSNDTRVDFRTIQQVRWPAPSTQN